MPVDKVREILKIAQEPVLWKPPSVKKKTPHLGDFIPDEDASEPSEAASFTLPQVSSWWSAEHPDPREEKSAQLRFGIEDGRSRTAGRSRKRIQRHPRAHSPDRGKGTAQTAPPQPQ